MDLFAALDYRTFLRSYYEEKKAKNRGFSFRKWAGLCGFAAPDYLLRVMRGERNLSSSGIESLSKSMGLKEKEKDYFSALVAFNQAKTPGQKAEYWREILRIGVRNSVTQLRQDQFELLRSWQTLALRSLMPVIPFDGDWGRLGRTLDPPLSSHQTSQAVAALEKSGLLKKIGKRYLAEEARLTTGDEVASLALNEFHLSMMDLAKRSLEAHPPSRRDISGITVSLSAEGVARFKQKIRDFRKQLLALASEDQQEDRVYHLNLHFFPLTRDGGWGD